MICVCCSLWGAKGPDVCVAKFGKITNKRKLYLDKLKLVQMFQYHLNCFLANNEKKKKGDIPSIDTVSWFQIYTIRYAEYFYVLELVETAKLPITHKDIKDGDILKFILFFLKKPR